MEQLLSPQDVADWLGVPPARPRRPRGMILGHITLEELRRRLVETEAANGFANRFLLACVRRSKLLATGGNLAGQEAADLGRRTRQALTDARRIGIVRRSEPAEARWADLYRQMAGDAPAGLVGAVTARAEAQTLRLSVAYALTDASSTVRTEHLGAAWATWRYCEASAAYVFGDSLGDEVADRLLEELRRADPDGLDGTRQRDIFKRHVSGARLDAARKLLEDRDLARTVTEATGGRPRTITYATKATQATKARADRLSSPGALSSQLQKDSAA